MRDNEQQSNDKELMVRVAPAALHQKVKRAISEAKDDEFVRRYIVRRLPLVIPIIIFGVLIILVIEVDLLSRLASSCAMLPSWGKSATAIALVILGIAGVVLFGLFLFYLLEREALRKKSIEEFTWLSSNTSSDSGASRADRFNRHSEK